ncbi:MAG: PilT/PilU family type 4a pilus ATPase [Candidatus Eisenbacteria sp.]|nr:PilT/PilU family type 4a pilus ATPase [Candidatus Eisenbacteria bacterium]
MRIGDVLEEAVRREASDLIISAGAPITYHVHGVLEPNEPATPLTPRDSQDLAYQLLNEEQRKTFEQVFELDLAFHYRDLARFRVSVYRQRGTVAAVLRLVPLSVPHYTDIGITEKLMGRLLTTPNGLVLVTGPTGAGKSTTVASFLSYLNTETDIARHIITIEDPIEFLLSSQVCIIDQRELGSDTQNYAIGLRSALRQMPHIIFVGEMRDRSTMEIALTAAETGNLVISTLSTQSASKTINRIIDVFPLEDQAEVRTRLALTLKAVISQVLLRRMDMPKRVAAREVLYITSSVSNLIREGKIHQIDNVIASSYDQGMVLLDDSLLELHRNGIVDAASIIPRLQDTEKIRLLV